MCETEEKEMFDAKLGSVLDQCSPRDTLIVLGDFNATIGTERDGYELCFGSHGSVIFAESLVVLVMALETLHEEAKPLGLEVPVQNQVLPQEIRILAWCPVPQGFSARFDCHQRTYKYFFPRGNLDLQVLHEEAKPLGLIVSWLKTKVQAMNTAGQYMVGEHDFRNLCKMDVANGVVNYKRCIKAVKVVRLDEESDGGVDERDCGDGYEMKPQYCLASDLPLNLWAVHFDGIAWRWDEAELRRLLGQMQGMWTQQAVRELETRYKNSIKARGKKRGKKGEDKEAESKEPEKKMRNAEEEVEDEGWEVKEQATPLMSGTRSRVYRPLLTRPTCDSLEKRIEHYIKRQRLDPETLQKMNQ
ncbi:tRNA pseudouridine(38/39) synthase [Chionoecetes opilio]|uniref:tRNA pseudouridine(38/39) synthase n=1 Tax=Chionoecetes opilio TaxID=41210 RepID=A0A8J8WL48_CHIOP|nr:tRNA pseudouridine(38/39) synthase [Chionoecetes opilio]